MSHDIPMISPLFAHPTGIPQGVVTVELKPGNGLLELYGQPGRSSFFCCVFFHEDSDRRILNLYIYIYIIFAWWFGTCFFMFFHILGMSSSQLTSIFFRGVETTNQIYNHIYTIKYIIYIYVVMFIILIGKSSINWVMLTTWKESRIFKGNHPKRSQLWSERCMIFGLVPSIS